MNAYELLGIEDIAQENDNEERDNNDYIRRKANLIMNSHLVGFEKIKRMQGYTQDKLDDISGVIREMFLTEMSYEIVSNREKRNSYNEKCKPDITEEFKKFLGRLDTADFFGRDNKNAYNILNTRDLTKTSNSQYMDDHILLRKTIQLIESSSINKPCMKPEVSNDHLGEDAQKTIMTMFSYLWAYSKIRTAEDRKKYNEACARESSYIDVSHKAKTEKFYIDKVKRTRIYSPDSYNINSPFESEYNLIKISEVENINYTSVVGFNVPVTRYLVEKSGPNGAVSRHMVFSNINLERMKKDPIYAEQIERVLLSDKNISLGKEHLAGYIGELDANGSLQLSEEQAGVCMYIREQIRARKNKREDGKDSPSDPTDR